MAYKVVGRAFDIDKQPIPFASVFVSDSSGKPIMPSINTQTGDDGEWKLDGINDSDYITIRIVGLKPQIFSAKFIPSIPVIGTNLYQKVAQTILKPDEATTLGVVEIVASKYDKPKNQPKLVQVVFPKYNTYNKPKPQPKVVEIPKYVKPREKEKHDYGKYILIGGLLLLVAGVTIYYISKNQTVNYPSPKGRGAS